MRKVLVYNGGAVALEPFPTSVAGGASVTHQATVLWDHGQITELPNVSLQVAPAPDANQLIVPVMAVFKPTLVAPYTNISASGYAVFADPNDNVEIGGYFKGANSGAYLNAGSEPVIITGGPADAPGGALVPEGVGDLVGAALYFYVNNDGSGPFGDGHVDNTLRVVAIYYVVDLETGLLVAA